MSINALTPGRRSRTRESIGAVRHVFLDADQDVDRVLRAIADRSDLPAPSYIVRSSKRVHVLWRVEGSSVERVDVLEKHLARELDTDVAATSAAQMTRLPGANKHKYTPPQIVEVTYGPERTTYRMDSFPEVSGAVTPLAPVIVREPRSGPMPMMERARRYLAATPPAMQGQQGDIRTFRVCGILIHRFRLTDADALRALMDWNGQCRPPWTVRELTLKIQPARRQGLGVSALAT